MYTAKLKTQHSHARDWTVATKHICLISWNIVNVAGKVGYQTWSFCEIGSPEKYFWLN